MEDGRVAIVGVREDAAEGLAGGDLVAGLDIDLAQVAVHRQVVAVAHDDGVVVARESEDARYCPVEDGAGIGSGRGLDVNTAIIRADVFQLLVLLFAEGGDDRVPSRYRVGEASLVAREAAGELPLSFRHRIATLGLGHALLGGCRFLRFRLLAAGTFGGFGTLDGSIFDTGNNLQEHYVSEMRRYYSNIVGKYSGMVQKALAKLSGLEIKMICPSHGLVWKNPAEVVAMYDKWSRYESEKEIVIAYASMYGNTEQMADFLGSMLGEKGYRVHTYDVSKTHVSYIMSMIWKCRAVLLGTCAYNGFMHPMMEHLCNEIKIAQPKEKIFGLFGSSTWNGAGVKSLSRFMHENGFPVLENMAEIAGSYAEEKMEEAGCVLAAAVAESLK